MKNNAFYSFCEWDKSIKEWKDAIVDLRIIKLSTYSLISANRYYPYNHSLYSKSLLMQMSQEFNWRIFKLIELFIQIYLEIFC
jgi:hypothetical protein